jgi:acyl-CoA dehydrogenase
MTDQLLIDTAEKLFAAVCTHRAVQDAERDGWAPDVWRAVADAGFPWVSVPEQAGGSGGTLADAAAIVRIAGGHAAPVPLAETGMLAGWLLSQAKLELPDGPATVVPGQPGDTLVLEDALVTGRATRVAWARAADRVVAVLPEAHGWAIVSLAASDARIEPGTNLAGEPRDTLIFDGATAETAPAPSGIDADAVRRRGALTRSLLMAGALDRMSRLTVEYTRQRRQFGKPVAQFQAVQQHLVAGAQDAALVTMAAEVATAAAERGPAGFEIAAAKILAGQAAATATRAAHQAHGAMGMTQEYPLHHFSRRLWAWRQEYGDDVWWSARLGRASAALGADLLYPTITSGSRILAL